MSKLEPKHERLLEAFETSDSGQKILEEAAAKRVAERQKDIDALRLREADADAQFPRARNAVQDQIAKVRAAEQVLKDENAKLAELERARRCDVIAHDRFRDEIEARLRDIPEAALIAAFCWEDMHAESELTRRKLELVSNVQTHDLTGERSGGSYSNHESIKVRLAAIREAVIAAEGLLISVADPRDIPARLDALRSALPKVAPATIPTKTKK